MELSIESILQALLAVRSPITSARQQRTIYSFLQTIGCCIVIVLEKCHPRWMNLFSLGVHTPVRLS